MSPSHNKKTKMKITIKERFLNDTNSTFDKWTTDKIEYIPTIEDAKNWADTEEKLAYLCDIIGASVDTIVKYEEKIEKAYFKLLGPSLLNQYIKKHNFNDWIKEASA